MNFLPFTIRTNLVFTLVLVAFPTAIFCAGPAATDVPVKENFIAPKSAIVTLINELHASAPVDYFAKLSAKVSSPTSAKFDPTVSADEFTFYSKDTKETAEKYVTDIVTATTTSDDDAITNLLKVEDLTAEVSTNTPRTVPISLETFSNFIKSFDFIDGKFTKSTEPTKAWNFTLDEFMNHFKFYMLSQDKKDDLVKNIVEKINKKNLRSKDEIMTEVYNFLSGKFQDNSSGNVEITFTELKTALMTIVIDENFQLSQGTTAGTSESLFSDSDNDAFKKVLESDPKKTFVAFIDTTSEIDTIFSTISVAASGADGNAKLKNTFQDLETLLKNYAMNLFKKTIARDEVNKIFTTKFPAHLPAITDAAVSDDDCKIGSLPYLDSVPANTDEACFNEYVKFLKDQNKFPDAIKLPNAEIVTIIKSNLAEFKTTLEDKKKADDAQKTTDKKQTEADEQKKKEEEEAAEKKKKEEEAAAKKNENSSNSPADGNKVDISKKSTTSQPKKGMSPLTITLICVGSGLAGIGIIYVGWYFVNQKGSKI